MYNIFNSPNENLDLFCWRREHVTFSKFALITECSRDAQLIGF